MDPGLLKQVGGEAPERVKMLISKALLPMDPIRLGWALAVLSRDPAAQIADQAAASLRALPEDVKLAVVTNAEYPPPVLDVFVHVFGEDSRLIQKVATNPLILDESLRWIGANLSGPVLDVLANNQVRLVRETRIVEALIANSRCPMPVLAKVVETVVRSEIDYVGIVGFKPLADAFFADFAERVGATVEAVPSLDDVEEGAFTEAVSEGVSDTVMEGLLNGANATDLESSEESPEEKPKEEENERGPLWRMISQMSLPQKVRLAMQGNAESRRLLVKDPKQ